MDAVEDCLESCAHVIVDIEVVERLLRPENLEVSLRYVLKQATKRGSNILQLFRYVREAEPLRGKQKTVVGKSGKRRCVAGGWAKRVVRPWVSGAKARAPPCASSSLQSPLLQQGSSSARDKFISGTCWKTGEGGAEDCFREPGQGNAEIP